MKTMRQFASKQKTMGHPAAAQNREGGCSHIRPLCQYLQMNSGFTMLRVSYIRLDHTVRSVFSPIDHTRLIRLRVHEHIKCMSEKLHLHACILGIHRLDLELLRADDRKVILEGIIILLNKCLLEIIGILMLVNDLLFILLKLPLNDFLNKVDGHIHIVAHLLGADNIALDGDRSRFLPLITNFI